MATIGLNGIQLDETCQSESAMSVESRSALESSADSLFSGSPLSIKISGDDSASPLSAPIPTVARSPVFLFSKLTETKRTASADILKRSASGDTLTRFSSDAARVSVAPSAQSPETDSGELKPAL